MSITQRKTVSANRSAKHPVLEKFKFYEDEDKSECLTCNFKMAGHHSENLMRHLKRKHTEVFEEVAALRKKMCASETTDCPTQPDITKYLTKATLKVDITKQLILEACLELVTKNGRPLSLMEDSGFKKLLDPLCKACTPRIHVNRQNVRDLIKEKAISIRNNIKHIVKNRIFSLKVDCASRLDRSVIGINIQLIVNSKIQVHTLAMKEMHQEHTGANLANIILEVLDSYDIALNQVYTLTVDNGRNIVCAGKFLKSYGNPQSNDDEILSIDLHSDSEYDEEDEADNADESYFELNSNSVQDDIFDDSVTTVRCACHTLQLAVKDFLGNILHVLPTIREVCKKLRTPTIVNLLKLQKLPKAILDCPTRWNSTFKMLKRLLLLKSFCITSSRDIKELYLSHLQWQQICDIVEVLQPLYDTSIKLQGVDLSTSDFYFAWYTCRKNIEKQTGKYPPILLNSLKKRGESILFELPVLACLYLDPRFQVLLTPDQKISAKEHIKNLYIRKINLNNSNIENISETSSSLSTSQSEDEVENILKQLDPVTKPTTSKTKDKFFFIESFDGIKRLPHNSNIFKFWQDYKDNELKELAEIIIAVPSTQVSVERAFSTLKFILSDLRANIEESLLEDILIINLN